MSDLPADVLKHVVDVHCHPTDSEMTAQDIKELTIKICAMATRPSDQVCTIRHMLQVSVIDAIAGAGC